MSIRQTHRRRSLAAFLARISPRFRIGGIVFVTLLVGIWIGKLSCSTSNPPIDETAGAAAQLIAQKEAPSLPAGAASMDRSAAETSQLYDNALPPDESANLTGPPPPPPPEEEQVVIDPEHPTGFVRTPTLPAGEHTADDGNLHIIFSSGCNRYQHWQAELLLASAAKVGQRGRITRIVSGCYDSLEEEDSKEHEGKTFSKSNNDKQTAIPLSDLMKSTNPNFGLFMTPSFAGAKKFPWINKPNSIEYFMKHAKHELDKSGETIIAILDPDFVFLSQLSQTGAASPNDIIQGADSAAAIWTGEGPAVDVARPGRPVAQTYGLGGAWVESFDISEITKEEGNPANTLTAEEAAKYYSVGPPLIVHRTDMEPLSVLWVKYMHGVIAQQTDVVLESDMYAWNIASAALGLRHTLLDHYMVSKPTLPEYNDREAWEWVEPLLSEDLDCNDGSSMIGANLPHAKRPRKVPTFIHMAQRYVAPVNTGWPREWSFAKSHVPTDILDCDAPLLREPPKNLLSQSHSNNEVTYRKERSSEAWLQCNIVSRLNAAALAHKTKFCTGQSNEPETRKIVRLVENRLVDNWCKLEMDWGDKKDMWCWPNAQVEGVQSRKPEMHKRYSPTQRSEWVQNRHQKPDFATMILPDAPAKPVAPDAPETNRKETDGLNPALGKQTVSKPPNPNDPNHPTGYLKMPKVSAGKRQHDDGLLHIIFSSGCNWFQHWQSELLLSSAFKVGQRGRITRIVSGCYGDIVEGEIDESAFTGKHIGKSHTNVDEKNMVPLSELKSSIHEDFGLFLTPSFAGAKDFPWMNKANSINYFMQHTKDELDREGETVIAVVDPDFMFVSPMTQAPAALKDIIQLNPSAVPIWDGKGEPINVVKPGRPVGQRYEMGGHWVLNYDMKKITGDPNTPLNDYTPKMMQQYLDVGPPFMVHRTDMGPLAKLWATYMHGVLAQSKNVLLESDMHAYNMAAAHLGLKHTLLESYMISFSPTSHYRGEAWQWVDPLLKEDLDCNDPDDLAGKNLPGKHLMPSILHMAHNYKAPVRSGWPREWMFHKGHIPGNIFSCDTPLIKEPPSSLMAMSYAERPWEKRASRDAWLQCTIVSRFNKVLLEHKQKFCKGAVESRKLVRLIQKKVHDTHCVIGRDKWCWQFAEIEDLGKNWRTTLKKKGFI